MKVVFECSMPRTGSQLLKNILKENKDLAIQSDSPLRNRFVNFREFFKIDYGSVTIDSKQLTKSFVSFWLEGLRGWGKSINPNAKVYIEHNRMWADDLYTILNSFNSKIVIVLRDIKDIINSLDIISKNAPELNTDLQKLYVYKNTSQSSVFIRPVNSGKFLSLFDNVEFEITTQGVYSNSIVNVSGDSTLLIHIINADFTMINASLNNLDQDEDGAFNESQIILTVPINVPPYSLISYSSTGDILDRHRIFLHSKSIQGFNIYITNEHGVIIPNLTDYNISMSFFSEQTEVNQSYMKDAILCFC